MYRAFIVTHPKGTQIWITQFYLQIIPYLPPPRKHSPDSECGEQTSNCSLLLICPPQKDERQSWPGNKNKICPVNIIYSRVLYNNNIIIMSFINSTALCKIRCATGICLLHVDLHWLDVPERVQYKLSVTVRRCQQHKAPQYLTDCVTPASDIASRQRLRSASRHQLLVPRYQLSSLGCRSFAVAGPTTWISLSPDLRDPACSDESFRRSLKTFLFAKY